MSAFESIKQGLTEALAFAEGRETGAVVHHVEVPTVDVAAIRASTGLSRVPLPAALGLQKARC
jgi:putative transcriptional regulator